MTLDIFYKLLREATMAHPIKDVKCQFPQAFAVIGHYSDMNTANLGKTIWDYKNEYFFIRKWKATNYNAASLSWDYPLVAVQHYNFNAVNISTINVNISHNVTLGVYDILREPCNTGLDCQICSSRPQHKIETDTEKILFQIIDYIRTIKLASINGGEEQYYSHRYLDHKISENVPVKIINQNIQLFDNREPFFGLRADTSIEKVYGTEIRLTINITNCTENNYNFEDTEPLIALETCCK